MIVRQAIDKSPGEWTAYIAQRPQVAGPYRWRVPSTAVAGLVVQFVAHMRMRGAGGGSVLSPLFDHWDGGRVRVPAGTEWTTTEVTCEWHKVVGLALPEIELLPCPFCKVVPFWHGMESGPDGGVTIGADPHRYNEWWLECCSWARTPRYKDPRELAERRNKMILGVQT